ncbi:MAG: hypothetical protein AB8E15_10800 [Bdellovibrionales bacterium]
MEQDTEIYLHTGFGMNLKADLQTQLLHSQLWLDSIIAQEWDYKVVLGNNAEFFLRNLEAGSEINFEYSKDYSSYFNAFEEVVLASRKACILIPSIPFLGDSFLEKLKQSRPINQQPTASIFSSTHSKSLNQPILFTSSARRIWRRNFREKKATQLVDFDWLSPTIMAEFGGSKNSKNTSPSGEVSISQTTEDSTRGEL